jgi:hypothetical protein
MKIPNFINFRYPAAESQPLPLQTLQDAFHLAPRAARGPRQRSGEADREAFLVAWHRSLETLIRSFVDRITKALPTRARGPSLREPRPRADSTFERNYLAAFVLRVRTVFLS